MIQVQNMHEKHIKYCWKLFLHEVSNNKIHSFIYVHTLLPNIQGFSNCFLFKCFYSVILRQTSVSIIIFHLALSSVKNRIDPPLRIQG